jgi:hypothetical protein
MVGDQERSRGTTKVGVREKRVGVRQPLKE